MKLKMCQNVSHNDWYIHFFLNLDILIIGSKKGLGSLYLSKIYIEYHREEILWEQSGDTGVQREDTWSKRVDSRVRRGDT